MTREELAALLGPGVERVEPKQYEPETVAFTCPHCRTVFRILRWQESKPWVDKHVAECLTRSPAERTFYFKRRRWPRIPPVDQAARVSAPTGAERTRAWRLRKQANTKGASK